MVENIDNMLFASAAELEQLRALEMGIRYYERLDQCQLTALARRDKALAQIERWVEGLGQALREFSDEIITANLMQVLSDGVLADGALADEAPEHGVLADGTARGASSIAVDGEQAP